MQESGSNLSRFLSRSDYIEAEGGGGGGVGMGVGPLPEWLAVGGSREEDEEAN